MQEQIMEVRFLENQDMVEVEFAGKKTSNNKQSLLLSLHQDIAQKGFIVNDNIQKQDVGNFIYYQFFYFDGANSRSVRLQVPKSDDHSIRAVDTIKFKLDDAKFERDFSEYLRKQKEEIVFDNIEQRRLL